MSEASSAAGDCSDGGGGGGGGGAVAVGFGEIGWKELQILVGAAALPSSCSSSRGGAA